MNSRTYDGTAKKMYLNNTVIGLRKGFDTVVASAGLRTSSAGLILHHKSSPLRRIYLDKVIFATNTSEARMGILIETLNLELTRTDGEMRAASLAVARMMVVHRMFRGVRAEAILASKGFLSLVSSDGDVVEPEEGFVAIGSSAQIAAGAIKALLAHSDLSGEDIVRESLRIAGQLNPLAHDEVSLEIV